uniref:Immunoglobulin V-set domain-containing protein n=1 Tax=Oryzias sinensis TaxID=183150 RepID=A0A8C7YTE8_9TELE
MGLNDLNTPFFVFFPFERIAVNLSEPTWRSLPFLSYIFYFSKKYWCRGPSRGSCEILVDSEGVAKTKYTHRSVVVQVKRGIFVKVTNLQIDDSGVYWVGIDKPYSDIMVPVTLNVTQGNLPIDSMV